MGIDTKVIHFVFKDYREKKCIVVEFSICNYQKVVFDFTNDNNVIADAITKKILQKQELIGYLHSLALKTIQEENLGNLENFKLTKKICTKTSKAASKRNKWCPKACQSFTILLYCAPGQKAPHPDDSQSDMDSFVIRILAHQRDQTDVKLDTLSVEKSFSGVGRKVREAHKQLSSKARGWAERGRGYLPSFSDQPSEDIEHQREGFGDRHRSRRKKHPSEHRGIEKTTEGRDREPKRQRSFHNYGQYAKDRYASASESVQGYGQSLRDNLTSASASIRDYGDSFHDGLTSASASAKGYGESLYDGLTTASKSARARGQKIRQGSQARLTSASKFAQTHGQKFGEGLQRHVDRTRGWFGLGQELDTQTRPE